MNLDPKRRLLRLAARPRVGAAPAADDPGSVGRVPVLVAVAALALGALVIDQRVAEPGPPGAPEAAAVPLATTGDAPAATWYCAAGTARGSAEAAGDEFVGEHTVIIGNVAPERRTARVTLFPTQGEPVTTEVALPPHGRADVAVVDHVKAPFASATVEADGGLVTVVHRLDGPHGPTTGPCASSGSSSWFFPAGTSSPRSRSRFVLFNPFPNQAVVNVELKVQDVSGRQVTKKPDDLQAIVVPPRRPVHVDVSREVANVDRFAARVETRDPASHIVVDRVLTDDGDDDDPRHASVLLGATAPAPAWVFADARPRAVGTRTEYVLYNPGTEPVEAELRARVDRFDITVPPFQATVQPGEFRVVSPDDDLPDQQRVPIGSGYWVVAASRGGGTFVIERVTRVTTPTPTGTTAPDGEFEPDDEDEPTSTTSRGGGATTTTTRPAAGSTGTTRPAAATTTTRPGATTTTTRPGATTTTTTTTTTIPRLPGASRSILDLRGVTHVLGSPVLAPEWIVPGASISAEGAGIVAVTNLAGRPVKLTIYAEVEGRSIALREYEDVELPAGVRTTVDLGDAGLPGGSTPRSIRVVADGPVVTGIVFGTTRPDALAELHGLPVRGALRTPGADTIEATKPPEQPVNPAGPQPGAPDPGPPGGAPDPGAPGGGEGGTPGGG